MTGKKLQLTLPCVNYLFVPHQADLMSMLSRWQSGFYSFCLIALNLQLHFISKAWKLLPEKLGTTRGGISYFILG